MTDAEFLEQIRKDKRLTQVEMATLLGLKSGASYQKYIYQDKPFTKKAIEKFTRQLNLKEWNNYRPHDDYSLVQVLYRRVIRLEKQLTGKTEKQIKAEIEMQRKKVIDYSRN